MQAVGFIGIQSTILCPHVAPTSSRTTEQDYGPVHWRSVAPSHRARGPMLSFGVGLWGSVKQPATSNE